jgi:hypothetical protein
VFDVVGDNMKLDQSSGILIQIFAIDLKEVESLDKTATSLSSQDPNADEYSALETVNQKLVGYSYIPLYLKRLNTISANG